MEIFKRKIVIRLDEKDMENLLKGIIVDNDKYEIFFKDGSVREYILKRGKEKIY